MIKIGRVNINPNDVVDIELCGTRAQIKRKRFYEKIEGVDLERSTMRNLTIKVKNDSMMAQLKKVVIDRARAHENPTERICLFEWYPDFDKWDRMIEATITNKERRKEADELIEWASLCEQHGLDTSHLKPQIINNLQGTFKGLV